MQVNLNTQYSTNNNYKPAFTAVKLYGGSADVLKKVLKYDEWKIVEQIVDARAADKNVDLIFFGKGNKSLTARIVSKEDVAPAFQTKDKSVGLFESVLKFMQRMSKKAEALEKEYENIERIDIEGIISKAQK